MTIFGEAVLQYDPTKICTSINTCTTWSFCIPLSVTLAEDGASSMVTIVTDVNNDRVDLMWWRHSKTSRIHNGTGVITCNGCNTRKQTSRTIIFLESNCRNIAPVGCVPPAFAFLLVGGVGYLEDRTYHLDTLPPPGYPIPYISCPWIPSTPHTLP